MNRSGAGSIKTLSTAAATKRELGRNARDGPLVLTWSRLGTQDFSRNTVESCSALGTRQETQ